MPPQSPSRDARDPRGRWAKGLSGNPGGRPGASFARRVREATRDGADCVELALAILRADVGVLCSLSPEEIDGAKTSGQWARILQLFTPEIKDRLAAAKWLAERGHGRVPESEIDPISELSDEELRKHLAEYFAEMQARAPTAEPSNG